MAPTITDSRYVVKRRSVNGSVYASRMANRDRTNFASRVIAAREYAGMTQHDLGAAAGIKQSTIAEMEVSGKSSLKTPQIAKACGVDAYWLATGEGEMIPSQALPFKTLTLTMLKQLSPKALESIEMSALGLLSLAQTPTLKPMQRIDTDLEDLSNLRLFDNATGEEIDRADSDTGKEHGKRGKRPQGPPKRGGVGGI